MDQTDAQLESQRSKNIRAKFTVPLCCFGAGSQVDAELTINTNEKESKIVEDCKTESQPKAGIDDSKPTTDS